MAGKPIADPGPEHPAESASDAAASTAAAHESGERVGPLQLLRLSKEDGRALIVYSRSPTPPPP
jgi:hypothetical protein